MQRSLGMLVALLALGAAAPGQAQTTGNADAGRNKAGMCEGCHSIGGYRNAYRPYSVPKLGGQHAQYLVAALMAYRSGARDHGTMHAIAASLTDQDMADLAAYFAAKRD